MKSWSECRTPLGEGHGAVSEEGVGGLLGGQLHGEGGGRHTVSQPVKEKGGHTRDQHMRECNSAMSSIRQGA